MTASRITYGSPNILRKHSNLHVIKKIFEYLFSRLISNLNHLYWKLKVQVFLVLQKEIKNEIWSWIESTGKLTFIDNRI